MLAIMEIFVPSTYDRDQPMGDAYHRAIVREVMLMATDRFGGATAIPGLGSFKASDGRTIVEPVTVVSIGYDVRSDGESWIRDVASRLADRLGQESVTVVVDGMMEFVEPVADPVESDADDRPASISFGMLQR